jgi:hypothetical protein
VVPSFHFVREGNRNVSGRCEGLELCGWHVFEALVQAVGVEPADVLDDRQLELGAGAPDAVADQLGLEAVDEGFGHRVVVGVATEPIEPRTRWSSRTCWKA